MRRAQRRATNLAQASAPPGILSSMSRAVARRRSRSFWGGSASARRWCMAQTQSRNTRPSAASSGPLRAPTPPCGACFCENPPLQQFRPRRVRLAPAAAGPPVPLQGEQQGEPQQGEPQGEQQQDDVVLMEAGEASAGFQAAGPSGGAAAGPASGSGAGVGSSGGQGPATQPTPTNRRASGQHAGPTGSQRPDLRGWSVCRGSKQPWLALGPFACHYPWAKHDGSSSSKVNWDTSTEGRFRSGGCCGLAPPGEDSCKQCADLVANPTLQRLRGLAVSRGSG